MFVGHLAAAMAAKKFEPEVPLSATVAAAFGIDLIWPVLLLSGVESVVVEPGNTAFTPLFFESYPWSHSLLMVVAWGALAFVLGHFLLSSKRGGIVLALLVVSHWVLDFVTHRPDLPLWPGGPMLGLGLWNSIPATLAIEGSLFGIAFAMYVSTMRARDTTGRIALAGLVLLTFLIWVSQPWAPPAPSATAVALTTLALWLLPPWAHWIEKHRESTATA